jgi:transcriptional regulator with XRE-family HTH domain
MKTNEQLLTKESKNALLEMGTNIRNMRILKGMTQKKFCEYSGISRMTLHAIENGSPTVQLGNLLKALQTIGMESHLSRIGIYDKLWINSLGEQITGIKRVGRKSTTSN